MTALCGVCGTVKIKPRYKLNKSGLMTYRCKNKYKKMKQKARLQKERPYVKSKKDRCESCGFIAVHSSQLDVDHIDGNRSNNNESNLQTLCANCHRLKTYLNKDYLK
jgi:5-methylcytosine-specific restriction endonuclease McrA